MKITYAKACTSSQELIHLLKARGLTIANERKAIRHLTNIGYSRLGAYLHPLLKDPKDEQTYKEGASLDQAMSMYGFDWSLRGFLFREIEKLEIAIRSGLANMISSELDDVFWMTNAEHFRDQSVFDRTITLIQAEIGRTKEDFIARFQLKYDNPYPPAWLIAEIIPFGMLCGIFNNLKVTKLKKKLAGYFQLSLPVFSSWIVTLVNLRNLCAHHSRTWNRESPVIPAMPQSPTGPWINDSSTDMKRLYYRLCIIKYMLAAVAPDNKFTTRLKQLLSRYPSIDLNAMGFTADWQNEPLWMPKRKRKGAGRKKKRKT
jgi:abortive infection bacteriophage resistance protein